MSPLDRIKLYKLYNKEYKYLMDFNGKVKWFFSTLLEIEKFPWTIYDKNVFVFIKNSLIVS